MKKIFFVFYILFFAVLAHAGANHSFEQIDTCYHWLQYTHLDYKIDHAEKNNGELFFGGYRPIYCWRSPIGALNNWERHGDVLIRIKFKPGTPIIHRPRIASLRDMIDIGISVIYSNDNSWQEYTIAPSAVESWSVSHPNLTTEIKAELRYYEAGLATANDVFYPFEYFNMQRLKITLSPLLEEFEKSAKAGKTKIYGSETKRHFQTQYKLPWHKFLVRNELMKIVESEKMRIVKASYGANIDPAFVGNVTTSL